MVTAMTNSVPPAEQPSLTDSPWFWIYLYGGMAVVAIFVVAPKYASRLGRMERMSRARQEVQSGAGAEGQAPHADEFDIPEKASIEPLMALGGLLIVGLLIAMACRMRYRSRRGQSTSATDNDANGIGPSTPDLPAGQPTSTA